jgi:hypothetical protein
LGKKTPHLPAHAGVLLPRILRIFPVAEMQGEFESTLVIEMGSDNASKIRVAE